MPKTRLQETIFTIMMVLVMVYGMICYNISLEVKGMQNFVFVAALSELPIMGIIAFLLDTFIVGGLAKKITFNIFNPKEDKQIFIVLGISIFSILFMCPLMSLAATLLFKSGFSINTISTWITTTALNFPMAFFLQLLFAGPIVRYIFGKIVKD